MKVEDEEQLVLFKRNDLVAFMLQAGKLKKGTKRKVREQLMANYSVHTSVFSKK